jgi:hypothetical protein
MSSAPPEAAALVQAIADIERGGAVPPRPLRASTAAAVAASRASVDAARAAALATSAATLASAPPLVVVVGSVPRRAPSWLRERLSQPLMDPLDDMTWPPLVGAALCRAVLRRASTEGERGAAAVAWPPADAACDDAFSLADALAWSELGPGALTRLGPGSLTTLGPAVYHARTTTLGPGALTTLGPSAHQARPWHSRGVGRCVEDG